MERPTGTRYDRYFRRHMKDYPLREATVADAAFLAEVIISAEKSGTERLGLASLCGLDEGELRSLLIAMLEEDVDGCEFSPSSFLIAEHDGIPVAALAAWMEGQSDDMPSKILKANLIAFTFPAESLRSLQAHASALADLQIERERGTLQLEYLHVDPAHRGKGLAGYLIDKQIERALTGEHPPSKVQMQPFSKHFVAVGVYEKLGFRTASTYTHTDGMLVDYLPYTERLLMERTLNQ